MIILLYSFPLNNQEIKGYDFFSKALFEVDFHSLVCSKLDSLWSLVLNKPLLIFELFFLLLGHCSLIMILVLGCVI